MRTRYPVKMIADVLREAMQYRSSWKDYLKTLRHGPRTDILVYSCTDGTDAKTLSKIHMEAVSSDLTEAISTALADGGIRVEFDEPGGGPTTVLVASLVDGVEYEGAGTHEMGWAKTPSGRCAQSDRNPGEFDDVGECRALAVCLAILDMYRLDGGTDA